MHRSYFIRRGTLREYAFFPIDYHKSEPHNSKVAIAPRELCGISFDSVLSNDKAKDQSFDQTFSKVCGSLRQRLKSPSADGEIPPCASSRRRPCRRICLRQKPTLSRRLNTAVFLRKTARAVEGVNPPASGRISLLHPAPSADGATYK